MLGVVLETKKQFINIILLKERLENDFGLEVIAMPNALIRMLPYINYGVIKNNPKIFMGYSDTTVSHFILNKAGLVSFYGPSIMCEFGEYVKMFDYTKEAVENILFKDTTNYEIKSSKYWSNDFVAWEEGNINKAKKLVEEEHGYEVLSGSGVIKGQLLGGMLRCFPNDIRNRNMAQKR